MYYKRKKQDKKTSKNRQLLLDGFKNSKSLKRKIGGKEIEQEKQNISNYVYSTNQISTQQNIDANYKEIGVIHVTESQAINVLRSGVTEFFNFFGSKGFDNIIYDKARNVALELLAEKLQSNQKICNLRMDINTDATSTLIFVHLYGTLLEKVEENSEMVNIPPPSSPTLITNTDSPEEG